MIKKIFLFILVVCFFVALFFSYLDSANAVLKNKKLTVVATTSMIADAVRCIVGDAADVYALMGPGVDPHLYRARESDVHKLAAADIVFYNGLHLEGKVGHVLAGMNRFTKTVAVSDVLNKNELRTVDFDDMYDPHIWFDVSLWLNVAQYIAKNLIDIDPAHADLYEKNSKEYSKQLEQLHSYIHERVAQVPPAQRILVTAHDAFGYFGRAYGFEVVGLQGLSTDSDISTKDIQVLADYIVEKKIKAVFVESSIPQRTLMAVHNAVQARGWHIAIGDELYSDALGDNASDAATYCGMVKYNVDTIVRSLS